MTSFQRPASPTDGEALWSLIETATVAICPLSDQPTQFLDSILQVQACLSDLDDRTEWSVEDIVMEQDASPMSTNNDLAYWDEKQYDLFTRLREDRPTKLIPSYRD